MSKDKNINTKYKSEKKVLPDSNKNYHVRFQTANELLKEQKQTERKMINRIEDLIKKLNSILGYEKYILQKSKDRSS